MYGLNIESYPRKIHTPTIHGGYLCFLEGKNLLLRKAKYTINRTGLATSHFLYKDDVDVFRFQNILSERAPRPANRLMLSTAPSPTHTTIS
jgi:hypothetical protein